MKAVRIFYAVFFTALFPLVVRSLPVSEIQVDANEGMRVRKIKDIVVYEDEQYYSSFPSVVKNRDGELLVAFRRAPDRKIFGEEGTNHVDPNSYLVMVRSDDDGSTWTDEPDLL